MLFLALCFFENQSSLALLSASLKSQNSSCAVLCFSENQGSFCAVLCFFESQSSLCAALCFKPRLFFEERSFKEFSLVCSSPAPHQ